ncbi:tetratricopeptide repeat protein [Microbulbifer guangxiensis]|uniref:tetratricopeptide repeat protein n=1 Tax=Microbulbifer guangxiensis TaxID=2904249 RepID=UPI001F2DDB6E|nr:tetratricopeptide repeat protein [Microbulbifer guangxiensis]
MPEIAGPVNYASQPMTSSLRTFPLLIAMALIAGCDDTPPDSSSQSSTDPTAQPGAKASLQVEPTGHDEVRGKATAEPRFVGSETCATCHQAEFEHWQDSHHDLAMQEASKKTILGDFGNAEFNYFGTTTRFYTKGDRHYVRTDGADGQLADFPIAYTFGIHPLQQYLVELPGGRLQALSIAWDSRDKSEGGQRWFHLNPDEHIKAGDELHWTGLNYNWNFMCADCHSTNLQKGFDLSSQTYDTRWSEIDVGCEACHGPGSDHLEWAQSDLSQTAENTGNRGFAASYSGRKKASWVMDHETGIARLAFATETQAELETCAQCHSRRSTAFPGARAGDALLDHFNLSLLDAGLYHADGQIDDEVFVYGSFLQSKMHAAGVTCSNCHEPHRLELRAEGNGVCAQCHMPARFDTAEHHFHPKDSAGSQCVSCHMPAKTYMQVDARRDHSFRVPRPDLSDRLQTPNACTGCHTDKPNQWATQVLQQKFGEPLEPHFGEAIYAGRHGLPGAESQLMALVADDSQPAIARATAVSLLPRYLSQQSAQLLQVIAQGDEQLLNLGLAKSLDFAPEQIQLALAIPLIYEGKRVTEALAANAMVDTPMDRLPQQVRGQFNDAVSAYLTSEKFNSDRPESLSNLAAVHVHRGNLQQAERFYRRALSIAPYFTPAYVNLAELYRSTNREKDAEKLLQSALERVNEKAPVLYSLGLSLVRQQRNDEALEYLRRAAESENTTAHFIYVYAIGQHSAGEVNAALATLERGLQQYPHDPQILSALVALYREAGNPDKARQYQQRLHSSASVQ